MIGEERMRTFINSLDAGNTPFLDELECSALSEGVPIIRKEMQSFIKTLLALAKPQTILEVGTAVGFSTLLMCEYGIRLLAPGGLLMSDNVLQEGELIESHYLVERRNRTIYKRMRDYLFELKHHPQLTTSIIPLGDGVSVSVKEEL